MGKNFSRRHFEIFFLFFPWKPTLTFHANCLLYILRRQFAWNDKVDFLGKMIKLPSVCRLINLLREWSCWNSAKTRIISSYDAIIRHLKMNILQTNFIACSQNSYLYGTNIEIALQTVHTSCTNLRLYLQRTYYFEHTVLTLNIRTYRLVQTV